MANKNLSVWTSIQFWCKLVEWVTRFTSILLIGLTFDTLGQTAYVLDL